MINLKPDMKVKCIDCRFSDSSTNSFKISKINLPQEGEVYTVRDVAPTKGYGTGIRLAEIQNEKYFIQISDTMKNQPLASPASNL